MAASLDYERGAPRVADAAAEWIGDSFVITVPYKGPWPALMLWVRQLYEAAGSADLLGFLLFPLIAILHAALWLVFKVVPVRRPPLLLIRIGRERIHLEALNQETGTIRNYQWPRERVVELRANRFESGCLWVRVEGELADNVARGLDARHLEQVSRYLEHVGMQCVGRDPLADLVPVNRLNSIKDHSALIYSGLRARSVTAAQTRIARTATYEIGHKIKSAAPSHQLTYPPTNSAS